MSWFSNWFNSDYLALYRHRNLAQAAEQVHFVLSALEQPPRSVLDIACGGARHLVELSERTERAFGIDLSTVLLGEARTLCASRQSAAHLIQADMRRLPFNDGSFDLLTSFFTSFGYFDNDAEHRALLEEWRRVSCGGATLVLDYFNKPYLMQHLQSRTEAKLDDRLVVEERFLSSNPLRVHKRITMTDHSGNVRHYEESVRLYDREELTVMLRAAGFELTATYGDFTGQVLSDNSERLIIFANAATAGRSTRACPA
jgi:ubiquinone/menaquinone biosynthesis C-methylase UbiE